MVCTIHVLGREFAFLADIHHVQFVLLQTLREFFGGNAFDSIHFLADRTPCGDAAFEETEHIVVAHTSESRNHFLFVAFIGHDQERLFHIGDHGAHPRSEITLDPDVDRARNESILEGLRTARIQHQRTFRFGHQLEFLRRQRTQTALLHFIHAHDHALVHRHVLREVGGWRHQSIGHLLDELFLAFRLERVIVALLVAQRIPRLFAHVLAAGAAGTVRGIHDHIIGQGHDLGVQTFVEVSSEILLCDRTGFLRKIRATDITDE